MADGLRLSRIHGISVPWCEGCGTRGARYVASTGVASAVLCGPCAMDTEARLGKAQDVDALNADSATEGS